MSSFLPWASSVRILLVGFALFHAQSTFALAQGVPPGNDDCATATSISGTGVFAFDSRFATPSAGVPVSPCAAEQGKDVWYSWTSPFTGCVTVSLCGGATFDSVLTIHAGSCGALIPLACNDDACGAASFVTFTATAGTNYVIRIASYGDTAGAAGTFTIAANGTDTDGDGTPDCVDGCPTDPLKIAPGACGCGISDQLANLSGEECLYDDGASDKAIGATTSGGIAWLQRFGAAGQARTVRWVATAWGSKAFPGLTPEDGTSGRVAIWEDPNDDGDPTDALLLATVDVRVVDAEKDHLTAYEFAAPVTVNGIFFVGASVTATNAQAPAPLDTDACGAGSLAWLTSNAAQPVNLTNLAANSSPIAPISTLGHLGVWLLRIDCGEVIPDPCHTLVDLIEHEFLVADWSAVSLGASIVSTTRETIGGIAGAYRRVAYIALPGAAYADRLTSDTYNAAQEGLSIESVSITCDVRSSNATTRVGLVLKQGANHFLAGLTPVGSAGSWHPISIAVPSAGAFVQLGGSGQPDFLCSDVVTEAGVYVIHDGAPAGVVTFDLDRVKIRYTTVECVSNGCCDDALTLDVNGEPILPANLDPEHPPVFFDVTEDRGLLDDLYPGVDTSLGTWLENFPCERSIGGMIPADAASPDLVEELEAAGITGLDGVTPEEFVAAARQWSIDAGNRAALEIPVLPTAPPASGPGSYVPVPPFVPDPAECWVLGGRDIVFVHGLKLEHLKDRFLFATGGSQADWQTPTTFPGSTQNPEFYGTPQAANEGYYKSVARKTWEHHIQRFLTDKGAQNRYMHVAYPCNARLEVGVQAFLTQIADAMRTGTDVIDPANPGAVVNNFGSNGFVVVSHSTGALVTGVAMRAAELYPGATGLNAEFVPDHCKAHVSFAGAFRGSGIASLALAITPYLNVVLALYPYICATVDLILVLSDPFGSPAISACGSFKDLMANSVLVDLDPTVGKVLWSSYIDSTPVPTLMIPGGHPTQTAVLKHFVLPGFDDGVTTTHSAVANPVDPGLWPPGYVAESHHQVFDMGLWSNNEKLRAKRYFVDQVIDPHLGVWPSGTTTAAAPNPWLSCNGMLQPIAGFMGHSYNALRRPPRHYSFLQSAADHFQGTNGATHNGFIGNYYQNSQDEPNWEESTAITDAGIFAPDSHGPNGDMEPLVRLTAKPREVEARHGRKITLTIKIFKKRWTKTWWIWRRTYHRLEGWQAKVQADYVYEAVLNSIPPCTVDTPTTPYCFGDGSSTACPCANNSPVGAFEGCLSSFGFGGRLRASGVASIGADTLTFACTQVPNGVGLYFQGTTQIAFVFGDGLRCVGGSILRLGLVSATGNASAYPGSGQPPVSIQGNCAAGDVRNYQVWYRNAANFCTASTFNLTNAVNLTWM